MYTRRALHPQCLSAAFSVHLLLAAILAHPALLFAQQQPATGPAATPAPTATQAPALSGVVISPDRDYRLGPRDVVQVRIDNAPELSGSFEINAGGTIRIPVLERVTAKGLTTEELADEIASQLKNKDYLREPNVVVTVLQIGSCTYFAQGAVTVPGKYQIEGHPSLLKLLAVAGGLAANHGSTAFILRERPQPETTAPTSPAPAATAQAPTAPNASKQDGDDDRSDYEAIRVNIAGILRGDLSANTPLQPGDIVHVMPASVFYVSGEVRAPGSFTLAEGTTLRQAISLAQGPTFKAAKGHTIIVRNDPDTGKRIDISVDLGAVMEGKAEDVAIKSDDIIIVPNSRARSVGSALLSAFGLSAIRIPY
jgi:polysaccharide export outer membrane protein